MNCRYYITLLAIKIKINAHWMIRSGSWYEQEIINSLFNVDNIFMAYKKKLFLFLFFLFFLLINGVRLILILGQSEETQWDLRLRF